MRELVVNGEVVEFSEGGEVKDLIRTTEFNCSALEVKREGLAPETRSKKVPSRRKIKVGTASISKERERSGRASASI